MSLSDVAKRAKETKPEVTPPSVPKEPAATNALSIPSAGLLAVIEAADRQQEAAFPLLLVAGGAQGGTMSPAKNVPPEIANRMPQGKMPIEGVFIGLRTEVTAWATDYDHRDLNEEGKPLWSIAASAHDQAGAILIEAACKNYQYTKKDAKAAFDQTASGIGHIRPTLQVMVWSKTLGDIIIVQSPPSYDSWVEGLRGMLRLADPATGALSQFPMVMRVTSVNKSSKAGFTWLEHYFSIDAAVNAAGGEMLAVFKTWRAGIPQENVEKVNSWLAAVDHPITDDIKALLVKAKGIRA